MPPRSKQALGESLCSGLQDQHCRVGVSQGVTGTTSPSQAPEHGKMRGCTVPTLAAYPCLSSLSSSMVPHSDSASISSSGGILLRGLSSESQSAARSCIRQPPQPLRGTAFLSLGGSSSLKQYPASSLIPCTLKMAHLFHPPFSCFCPSEPYQTGHKVIHVHLQSCTQSSFSILRLRFEGSGLLRVSPDGFLWEAIIPEPPFPHQ